MTSSPIAIIGHPVGHSISPAIHNAAFAALGMPPRYVPCNVLPNQLEMAVIGLVALGFRGANVTIPHKESVIPFLDELSPAAHAIGAVNTIVVRENGTLFGENTDHVGFAAPLRSLSESFRGKRAVVLGAGGAARAVVYALLNSFDFETVSVSARTVARAEQLAADMSNNYAKARLEVKPWTDAPALSGIASLIVNTTPIGMTPGPMASPIPLDCLREEQVIYDLIYKPRMTRLLGFAREVGARGIGGLPMLLGQAAEAFMLWTGQEMPVEEVRGPVSGL